MAVFVVKRLEFLFLLTEIQLELLLGLDETINSFLGAFNLFVLLFDIFFDFLAVFASSFQVLVKLASDFIGLLGFTVFTHPFLFAIFNESGELFDRFFFRLEFGLSSGGAVFKPFLGPGKVQNLFLALGKFGLDSLLGVHKLLDSVVLGESEAGTLLNDLVQMSNFGFEFRNNFTGLFFFFFGKLNKLPRFFYFFLQYANS